jgi:DNA-binding response OmpR family regulator
MGKGARFYVELPRDRAHLRGEVEAPREPDAASASARALDAPARPDWTDNIATRDEFRLMEVAQATERRIVERDVDERSRGRTILVVEDTPDVVRLIHLILRQQFRIFTAPDGKRGLELALREAPHLIITDLMMPEMDGYELTRALRANERTRHIPIVMLTARGQVEDRVQGLESGVSAYLTKPFAARELLTTVRKLLEVQDSTTDLVLTRQMDSMEIVAGGLAHEINNPLNYIKNSLARVRKDVDELVAAIAAGTVAEARVKALDARMKAMFKTAESGVARILNTVDLMRRYSREGYSRVSRDHDLFTAARDVVDMVLPATGRAVKVTTHFTGDGLVLCVPEEMHQLLTNLVQNAIEAAPDGDGARRGHRRRDRRRGHPHGARQRPRREARGPRPHLRPLLHHQGPRGGHGHGPHHRVARRAGPRRHPHRGGEVRRGRLLRDAPAALGARLAAEALSDRGCGPPGGLRG